MKEPPRTTATFDSGMRATMAFVSSKYWKLKRYGASSEPGTRSGFGRPPVAMRSLSRSEEHTSELQSQSNLVCRLLLEKKKTHWSLSSPHSISALLDSVE